MQQLRRAPRCLSICLVLIFPEKMAADNSLSSSLSRTLVDKPNTKSQVWKHFGLAPDADGKPKEIDKPRCKLCFEEVIAKYGNTSNLFAHLKTKLSLVHI